jgi:23S rRNA (uracil1939-C5)-methyltransferase
VTHDETEELIERLAARGDGVTASGRHVAMGAPGDYVRDDGSLRHGPHHAEPACRHYGACGGCQLQHVDDVALGNFVVERVVNAARGQKLEPERSLRCTCPRPIPAAARACMASAPAGW